MKILIGCEYSATVRDAFSALGHDAWSCDLLPSERGGKHLQCDVFQALEGSRWDLIILHPPCTKIALCGNRNYGVGKPRHDERISAIDWTTRLWRRACELCRRVALENPKNVMGAYIGKKTQTIHPWQFGHPEQKETWIWLHGLPELVPTNDVHKKMMELPRRERGFSLPRQAQHEGTSARERFLDGRRQWRSSGQSAYLPSCLIQHEANTTAEA